MENLKYKYDYDIHNLDKLNTINIYTEEFKRHYIYKKINFFCNIKSESNNLLINFHGAVTEEIDNINRLVFRGHNYNIENTDIVCLSDGLINLYKGYKYGWFLSTEKYDFNKIYYEIFYFFVNSNKYKNVIFTGSSAGGYPSIYWSAIFNGIAVVSNSQIYLEDYGKNSTNLINREYGHGLSYLFNNVKKHEDSIIYNKKNIEDILKYNIPKKIILYNNFKDYNTYYFHTIPFIKFLKSINIIHILDNIIFDGEITDEKLLEVKDKNKTQEQIYHTIFYPNGQKHIDVIKDILKKL